MRMTDLGCDAVVFDLDGVLVDSAACVERHWRRWAAEHRLDLDGIMRVELFRIMGIAPW